MKEKIERFNPLVKCGLTDEQINKRIADNLVNFASSVPTKSIKQIIFENFFTLFNLLNLVLGVAIFLVGSYKNMTFLAIMLINTAISTFQEIHSKKVVDKLAIMTESKVKVIRSGNEVEISINDLVLDDIVVFNTGSQIPTDCVILEGNVLANESFITGEPDSITKVEGEMLLSGSYIVGGKCYAKVEHIGDENYTAQISSGAKYVKKVNSEIMKSLNNIIKWLTFAIIPIGALLFWNQISLDGANINDAVVQTVAAVIGMIPEGLVLLTSTVLAVSIIRLSKSKVLVQELYCIETLARVDTLCLDKTGTLTEGRMEVNALIGISGNNFEEMHISSNTNVVKSDSSTNLLNILANFAKASDDENPTMQAIKAHFLGRLKNEFTINEKVAFSSKAKWSGVNFENEGTYVLGAPEFILQDKFSEYEAEIRKYTEDYRVLLLAHSSNSFKTSTKLIERSNHADANISSSNNITQEKDLPDCLEPIGLILITDVIRKEATKTLEYFKKQDVDIKIISGDNPITVAKIAKRVGVSNAENYIDMSTLKTEEEISQATTKYAIFGRVSPTQKKDLVVALQKQGKTVAMTGDGVNDVLALKTADCSIAMANGSDATKNVSQLILLDSNFASMPKVVGEGRRTINNIERSASLFLVKTIYSCTLALLFLFLSQGYPFEPVHLSLIGVVTIGIPSFMLALEPNNERIHGRFLKNVIAKAIPTALTTIISILAIAFALKFGKIPVYAYSSLCVIATAISGFSLLFTLSKSRKSEHSKLLVSPYRFILTLLMIGLFIIGLTFFSWWFNIVELVPIMSDIVKVSIFTVVNFVVWKFVFNRIFKI